MTIILIILFYLVLYAIYAVSPLWVRILITVINFFMPDPIPVLDEVLMISGIFSKIKTFGKIMDWFSRPKQQALYTTSGKDKSDVANNGKQKGKIHSVILWILLIWLVIIPVCTIGIGFIIALIS